MSATINCARIRSDEGYKADLRLRAQTDLFWLAHELLGYTLIQERYHRIVAEHYVQKDPRRSIAEQCAIKARLHLDPRGTYKAVDIETLIPTPSGFRRMADIHFGDKVFGADGRPCRVVGESPVYLDRPCFELEFSSGETIVCDADHLWETDSRRDRDNKKLRSRVCKSHPTVKTTSEIADTVYVRKELNHRVRLARPIEMPAVSLPVPPYVLGAWLGDGTRNTSHITLPEQHSGSVVRELEAEGEQVWRARTVPYRVTVGGLRPKLRALGCLEIKRIPEQYLWASAAQRLALLQGLMDTDGFCSVTGQCGFCNNSKVLIDQVRQLVASLGLRPYVFRFDAKIDGRSCGWAYRVMFSPFSDTPVFRMPRKSANLRDRASVVSYLAAHRQIAAARPVVSRPVKCIMVDSADSLYLVGTGFIPTHNSTLNMADAVQWLIGFPNIAGLLLSASTKLTTGFAGECTEHFVLARGATPSAFQELFPEYTITPTARLTGSYTAPCRTIPRKEASIMSSSIESSLSGWHFDFIKEDDVVDNRNAETATSIAKVKKNRHINRKMLMPWGYRDTAGTRYDPFDAYGEDIAGAQPGKLKILVRPALILNDGSRLTAMGFPAPDECTLVFPDLLSYEYLKEDYEADYSAFMTQYMNDAHGGKDIVFQPGDLSQAVLPDESIPATGEAVIAWRFACGSKEGMKYTAAAVGRIDHGRTYILDTVRGIFSPTALAQRIVALARKHYTHSVQIEATPGAEAMQRHIENEMLAASWDVRITWNEFEDDDGARDMRLKGSEPLLSGRRLFFADTLPNMRDVQRQYGNYGMVAETDLVDVIARVAETMPGSIALLHSQQQEDAALAEMVARDRYDRVYGISHAPASFDDLAADAPEEYEDAPVEAFAWAQEIAPGLGV